MLEKSLNNELVNKENMKEKTIGGYKINRGFPEGS